MRFGIIGGGISGLTYAAVLSRLGHEIELFEAGSTVGGVWCDVYPEVRLQNIASAYHLSDLPWSDPPDEHPTAEQIRGYFDLVVETYDLTPRLSTRVEGLEERSGGWRVHVDGPDGKAEHDVDYVIIATGQYTQPSLEPELPGMDAFRGEIVTNRALDSLERFRDRRVAVVGMGKTALDLAVFAARRNARVHHVFRTARWPIPRYIFGLAHYTFAIFSRFGSVMLPWSAQPTLPQRLLHSVGAPFVSTFWWLLSLGIWTQFRSHARGHGRAGRERLARVRPPNSMLWDMRSASALAPDDYYPHVASGAIEPVQGEVVAMDEKGLVLADGTRVAADVVAFAIGSKSPRFPFVPEPYRTKLESEPDGVQLYRHILHPRIPRLAFAGYNHGFLHIPTAEAGALWLDAVIGGRLELPSVEAMEASIGKIRAWKDANIAYESSWACAVNTRFHHYLDVVLSEIGVNPYRKLPNVLYEVFSRYEASDYAGIVEEYQRRRTRRPRRSLRLAT